MLLSTYQNKIISLIEKYVDDGYILSFNFLVNLLQNINDGYRI
jgi:hypothetical protein